MANPQLLLLDEVSLGLAPVVVKRIYEAMVPPRRQGHHDPRGRAGRAAGAHRGRHVACFLEGRISLEGKPADLSSEQITAAYFGM